MVLLAAMGWAGGLVAQELPAEEPAPWRDPHEAMPVLPPLEFDGAEALPAGAQSLLELPPPMGSGADSRRGGPPLRLPPAATLLPPRAVAVAMPRVERFSFEGNTLYPDPVLAGQLASFLHRELTPEDLEEICHVLTTWYVSHDYINSGATIPDREVRNGELSIQIIEGRLTHVMVRDNEHLAASYLERRAMRDSKEPLNLQALQHRLQVLQTDANVKRINAGLKPGHLPGEATLIIDVEENTSWSMGMDFHNYRPPDTGAEQVELWAQGQNLSGLGDSLILRKGLLSGGFDEPEAAGLDNLFARYRLPVTAADTQFELSGETRDYLVIDEAFRALEIEGSSWRAAAGLRHPLFRHFDNARSVQSELWMSLMLECQHSEASLLGEPFSTSPGFVNGELDLTVLRFSQEWSRRSLGSVLALNSTFSFGLGILGATDSPVEPDHDFAAWRLSGQYLARTRKRGDVLVVNAGLQLADDPLPSPEQWTLGGRYTVRGYRENTLISDNGIYGGIEYRIPLRAQDPQHDWRVSIAPFVDAGLAWDHEDQAGGRDEKEWLASVGVGLLFEYKSLARGELYWGRALHNREHEKNNLQDEGIHFKFTVTAF